MIVEVEKPRLSCRASLDYNEEKVLHGVAELDRKLGRVDRGDVDPGRRPRLHPVGRQPVLDELLGQSVRRRLADAASLHLVAADEKLARQEGPGGQDNRPRLENRTGICADAADF